MPHQLASQIYTDLVQPGRAMDERGRPCA